MVRPHSTTDDFGGNPVRPVAARWQRIGPVVTLLLLSPFIAELLSAATRASVLYVLIPEIMTWGCGALIIRELVRRWQGDRTSLLLLAPAIAIAEEIIIQQTSLAPLVWVHSAHIYGRFLGVNWAWLVAMVVYETVFVVLVPVELTELAFRGRRTEPWLNTRGLVITGAVFLFGAFLAWFAWVKNYRTRILHLPPYHPPAAYIVLGLAAIGLLAIGAYRQRNSSTPRPSVGRRLSAWLVGIGALVLAYPWELMIALNFNIAPKLPVEIALISGITYVFALFLLIRYISSAATWTDLHRFALCAGAVTAVTFWGLQNVWHGKRIDFIGELAFVTLAIACLVQLARSLITSPAGAPVDADEIDIPRVRS